MTLNAYTFSNNETENLLGVQRLAYVVGESENVTSFKTRLETVYQMLMFVFDDCVQDHAVSDATVVSVLSH